MEHLQFDFWNNCRPVPHGSQCRRCWWWRWNQQSVVANTHPIVRTVPWRPCFWVLWSTIGAKQEVVVDQSRVVPLESTTRMARRRLGIQGLLLLWLILTMTMMTTVAVAVSMAAPTLMWTTYFCSWPPTLVLKDFATRFLLETWWNSLHSASTQLNLNWTYSHQICDYEVDCRTANLQFIVFDTSLPLYCLFQFLY